MKTIALKKLLIEDYQILQGIVFNLKNKKMRSMHTNIYNDDYFNNLLFMDVTNALFIRFRTKIENQNKRFSNINLKINEAVVLLQCCNDYRALDHYEISFINKLTTAIHSELINL